MKLLLDIKDSKANFVLLEGLSLLSIKLLTPYQAKVVEDVSEANMGMKMFKSGTLNDRIVEDLLTDLYA